MWRSIGDLKIMSESVGIQSLAPARNIAPALVYTTLECGHLLSQGNIRRRLLDLRTTPHSGYKQVKSPFIPNLSVSTQLREYNWGATWKKSRGSGLENREYGRRDPSRWPRGSLYPQKSALISPTSFGRLVGIVRSRTQATEFSLVFFF
jgi:hypothetical protein